MADKYINETGLATIKQWANGKFATDADLDTLAGRVDDIVSEGGEPNTIDSITVNGTSVTPDANKNVALTVPTATSDLTNDGDGTSNYATEAYVATNGGKIDHITVNGTEQSISNKTVALTVPTKVSDLQNDGDGTTGSEFATKSYVDTNGGKIDTISVNGTSQTITNKNVDITVPTAVSDLTNVGGSSFLMTDGAKGLSLGGRQFGIMAGANLTCKSAAAGATQYRLSNTQTNRFACFAGKNGRLAIDQTDATNNGTAAITDISFANGSPISAYFGPTESSNDIIITVDRTVNPSAATTKLRIYGTSTSSDVLVAGQGCGASGGKAISLGQSCFAGGNQNIAFGNSSVVTANNSVAFGHTHLVNKQFCFAAGQGHDFTNASNGAGAVGICSELHSDTLFAVGNGVFASSGAITRGNAFEVTSDGGVILKSPNGTRFKIAVDDTGSITTSAVA